MLPHLLLGQESRTGPTRQHTRLEKARRTAYPLRVVHLKNTAGLGVQSCGRARRPPRLVCALLDPPAANRCDVAETTGITSGASPVMRSSILRPAGPELLHEATAAPAWSRVATTSQRMLTSCPWSPTAYRAGGWAPAWPWATPDR